MVSVADPGFSRREMPTPEIGVINLLLPQANKVWGKVVFLHLSVILFAGRVWQTPPPQEDNSPWADTPPGKHPQHTPPPRADPPRQTPLDRHPTWADTPSLGRHPHPKTATEAGGMHPTGMHSCQKLHENERNWTEGRHPWCPLPRNRQWL